MAEQAQVTKAKKEVVITKVHMTDGRDVDFPGKRRLQKSSDPKTGTVILDFVNGETRTFQIPADLAPQFACHGAEQKLGDEIAGVDDLDDAIEAIDELIERLNVGEWGVKRDASGIAGSSILVKALVEFYNQKGKPRSVESIRLYLKDKTQAEKMALRGSSNLKDIVMKLEAEKAARSKETVDTDKLFGDLDALPA
jgi:hypothetical protein